MGKNILLIDDERDFTELTGTLLNFHNFQVDSLNDPTEVEQYIKKKNYDIIVTDLMMPHLDGFELIDKLRSNPSYQKTPMIVLSAKMLTDEERKHLFQNDVHFLTKPFEPHGLVDCIAGLLK